MVVKVGLTEARFDDAQTGHVYILVFALIFMAMVMAVVGTLGLASAMSTSVIERTREFGVMRAIGATSRVVLRNVVSEGVFTGVLSWLIAIPLSLPLSTQVGNLVGSLSFRMPLPLFLSPLALGIWLVVDTSIGTAGSRFIELWSEREFLDAVTFWEKSLNHFLKTGEKLSRVAEPAAASLWAKPDSSPTSLPDRPDRPDPGEIKAPSAANSGSEYS
jgi:hypothetical protein